ncbi:MAG: putative secreted protein [Frankiales bacterium]|nr:putative secreted protein [Frankiales bacterium]
MAFHRWVLFLSGLAAFFAPSSAAADPPACVVIQRGALGAVADTSVVSFGSLADRNYGPDRQLYVGKARAVESRALIRFDLGEIPPRAAIRSATVTLDEPTDTGPMTIDVRRITAPWDERFSTWPRSAEAFDPAVEASFITRGRADDRAIRVDITPLVRAWAGGAAPNHGVILAARDPGLTELCSSEYPEAKRRPSLAKLDPDGRALWSRRATGSGRQGFSGIAADSAGNVVVTGSFEGDLTFTSGPPAAGPGKEEDIFLAKLGPAGDLLWEKRFGGAATDRAYGVAIGRGDDILLTGLASQSIDFGGGPVAGEADFDMFVERLGPDGAPRWGRRFGAATGRAIAVDASDDVIVGMNRSSVFYVGPTAPPSPGGTMGVLELDAGGNDVWIRRFSSAAYLHGLAVDAVGNVVLTGSMSRDVDFGGGPLRHVGKDDIFVAELDPEGRHLHSCAFGDSASQSGDAVAADRTGGVLLLGGGEGRTYYGPGLFVGPGSYVTKLAW